MKRTTIILVLQVILTMLFFLTTSKSALSQKQIQDQNNAWIWYVGNHRFTDRWGLHTEYNWRRNEYFEHWMQSLIRVSAEYYTKQGPVLGLGYAFIDTYEYGIQPLDYRFMEHRIYEQLTTSQQLGRFYTSNRFRFEHRWMEQKLRNPSMDYERNEDDPFSFRNRIRYRFMVNIPISKKTMDNNTLFLSLADEIFINAGKEIRLNVFDQNRIYATLGWRIDKDKNIQLGYLNQYVIKGNARSAERNHTVQIGITWGIDFRAKDEK